MRFVVLHHTDWPGKPDHYDLLIQTKKGHGDDRFLRAFATVTDDFPSPALDETSDQCLLHAQEDHRIRYLDYEGLVGGERGQVSRADEGKCEHIEPPSGSRLKCHLQGEHLRGTFEIRKRDEAWIIEKIQN